MGFGGRCSRCGAVASDGQADCRRLFEEVLALEYGNPAYGAVHLLTVDAHALQHSEDHGPRSNAFHLLRLYVLLERGGDPRIGWNPQWLKVQIGKTQGLPFLEPPDDQGAVTVADVHGAPTPGEHAERAWRWARSVWEAWGEYHGWARQWLREK